MVAGIITIVACSKDSSSSETQNGLTTQKTPNQSDEIDIAVWSNDSISFLFDKDNVLSAIQSRFQDSLKINCVMEDLNIYIVDVENEILPVVSISYFDIDNECSATMFGTLKQYTNRSSSIILTLGCGEIMHRCMGKNCSKPCSATYGKDPYGGTIFTGCTPCTAKNPQKEAFCREMDPFQGLISLAIFDSFLEGLN